MKKLNESSNIKNLHRLDLLKEFPNYEYGNAKEPWRTEYRRADNNVAAQIQAFHFFYANTACGDTGYLGISLLMPHIPYCLCISPQPAPGVNIILPIENLNTLFQPESVALIIISSAISLFPCHSLPEHASPEIRQRRFCTGEEIVPILREWGHLLLPGGVMIANLIDEAIARETGWSLFQKTPQLQHAWTPRRFEEHIITPMLDLFDLEEINTLRNHFSFNCVIRKK